MKTINTITHPLTTYHKVHLLKIMERNASLAITIVPLISSFVHDFFYWRHKKRKKWEVVYPRPPCTVKAHVLTDKQQHINSYCSRLIGKVFWHWHTHTPTHNHTHPHTHTHCCRSHHIKRSIPLINHCRCLLFNILLELSVLSSRNWFLHYGLTCSWNKVIYI